MLKIRYYSVLCYEYESIRELFAIREIRELRIIDPYEIHTKIGCVERIKVRISPMLRKAVYSKEDVTKETFNHDCCVCT
jgi:hypothetical protein